MKNMFIAIKKRLESSKGFTLIELIVVIAVLGMIASIAIPKVGNITERARKQADASNVQMLQSAVERYNAENGEYPDEASDLKDYVDKFPVQKDGSVTNFYFDEDTGRVVETTVADSKGFKFSD